MTSAEDLLGAVVRVAGGADAPAVTVEEERAKATRILDGLAEARVMSMPAPVEMGGYGHSILDAARVVAAVAAVSGSAGLMCAMHLGQFFALLRHGRGPGGDEFLARATASQWLIASGTSEVGVGGDILRSVCRTEPHKGGLRLIKSFANVSYLDRAAAILVTAMHDDGRRSVQRLILLETAELRRKAERETKLIGMRGMVHRSVTVEADFKASAVLPEPFAVIARTMSGASHILWSAVWSGLAASAVAKAGAIADQTSNGTAWRQRLAAAAGRAGAMNAMIRDACAAFDGGLALNSPFEAGTRFNALKISCAEMLGEIIADCAAVAGFQGYAEGGPNSLSEVLRDSFSARIMVSSDRLAEANAAVGGLVRERI